MLESLRPRALWAAQGPHSRWLSRFVFLRALGFCYAIAFTVLFQQSLPLIGEHGLLPARLYLARLHARATFWSHPTLFWFGVSDGLQRRLAAIGLVLSLVVLIGADNALLMAAVWALYLSFVHIGQVFYGYGWETLLLEAGFLAIFMCPVRHLWTLRDPSPVAPVMFVWLAWLVFRVMFGAGLIKLRGDVCWRDLTCLYYHYETQPVPHALSRVLHAAPRWFHRGGVLFNHFVEVIVPFFLFAPARFRHAAVSCVIAFQVVLILSGNLSFLNWLTIGIALGCYDDSVWRRLLPRRLVSRRDVLDVGPLQNRARSIAAVVFSCGAALLSISPIMNMLSPHQQMNTSFEPLHLLNSYGAFGSIGRERDEVILEGTSDTLPSAHARWRPYEFKCKPGDVTRRPCWVTPYHYRLDWQMWFAALSDYEEEPWLVHFVYKLLQGDRAQLALLANNPFPDKPPNYIRAERYRYHFTALGSRDYWQRERIGTYLPAVSRDNPDLHDFLAQYGLVRGERLQIEP